ncbi:MAG TPA: tetratricopeptide repeat protein [Polyangiaceae bacterium]|nr:tetratricopeptide repeat protein [Polyangiaceae bacterium]
MRSLLLFLVFCGWFGAAPALAQESSGPRADEPRAASADEPSAPKEHFKQALLHYRAGRYRAAIAELQAALLLDPKSKDLLYNLALVHEKLGELDEAIAHLEQYTSLEPDQAEVRRAEQTVARLRGARSELVPARTEIRSVVVPVAPRFPPPAAPRPVWSSRADEWVLASTGVAIVAAAIGVVFGVRALVLHPGSDPKTGPGTSIDALRQARASSRASARVADVGFAVSLGAGATAAGLWLLRECPCKVQLAPASTPGLAVGAHF